MRKITELAKYYFDNNIEKKLGNTRIETFADATYLYLHDNLIAYKNNNKLEITFAGWFSNTTKERLRAFADIRTKQGRVFVNNQEVTSTQWIEL